MALYRDTDELWDEWDQLVDHIEYMEEFGTERYRAILQEQRQELRTAIIDATGIDPDDDED